VEESEKGGGGRVRTAWYYKIKYKRWAGERDEGTCGDGGQRRTP